MFANRDIAKNEQLTFDYRQRTGSELGKNDIERILYSSGLNISISNFNSKI